MDSESVLIVDDDGMFRAVVGELLKSRGFDVYEARSGKEATALLGGQSPSLAIVDYRLPEMDGIAWITSIRESGGNFPIVFISGSWCDEKTFSRLRNLLKVSLILRKPIVPELFLQQIESVLPLRRKAITQTSEDSSASSTALLSNSTSGSSSSLNSLRKLRGNRDREANIAAIKAQYADEIAERWIELTATVKQAREGIASEEIVKDAINMAHKLSGTAGSVGFKSTGKAAARIEALLYSIDPSDSLQGVLWSEIELCLTDGQSAMKNSTSSTSISPIKSLSTGSNVVAKKILLLGQVTNYKALIDSINADSSVEVEICESLAALLQRAKRNPYDAAIFDLAMTEEERIFAAIKQLRELPLNSNIPVAAVLTAGTKLTVSELAFVGFTTTMPPQPVQADLEEACTRLMTIHQTNKSKILIADDDTVLTDFVSTILKGAGFEVQILNEPILVMEQMEEFNPDVVLLDVMMPGLSGYDVCNMLRTDARFMNVVIIFLTARNDEDGRAAAFQAGGDDFLSKPVVAAELLARVKSQLQQTSQRRGIEEKDAKTGSLSGAGYVQALDDIFENSRITDEPFSVCLLSVDNYADLGIEYGILNSRECATELGRLIHSRFKAEDIRGRIGEESFALAFPNTMQDTIAESIIFLLEEYKSVKFPTDTLSTFRATFSAGLSQFPDDGDSVTQLLKTANKRLNKGRASHPATISFADVTGHFED